MYDSPIKIIQDQIKMDMENEVMKAVLRCNIDVNKAELLKALKFDREQYDKGFSDCKAIYEKKLESILERLEKQMAFENDLYDEMSSGAHSAYSHAIKIVKKESGIE